MSTLTGNTEGAEGKGGHGENQITEVIIGAAMRVHTALGPGLLESAYEACLAYELAKSGLTVERQQKLPIIYGDLKLDEAYRIDLLIAGSVVVEIKATTWLEPIHEAQLLSYLRLSGHEVGLLLNFHVSHLREGIRRVINTRKTTR